jgi:tocopherol cyclase
MNLRFLHPEIFQGDLKNKNYFEGWYFKHVSDDLEHVYSFIPGVSLNSRDPHAFIQVINGITGSTQYITYPLDQFTSDTKSLRLKIGDSVFTDKYIDLNIHHEKINLTAHIDYSNIVKYPRNILSPGIMGWYSFVPYMECKHGIISVNHDLKGEITIDGKSVDLDNGKGYIEKDWGTSFPEAWIWIQSNNFTESGTSFNFSVAKIPWLGRFFVGFIAFLYLKGRFFLFSTYNKSKITQIDHDISSITISMKNNNSVLRVKVVKNSFGELRAPDSGDMSRRIKESIDSTVDLTLHDSAGNLIYEDSGKRAGLEIVEDIFNYIGAL